MTIHSLRYALFSLSLIFFTDCAQLPEYARPRTIQIDEIQKVANGFTYRQLTPKDFRATSMPANLSTHGKKINAQSATTIRITADSNFTIIAQQFFDNVNYLGRINHLAFEAVMIPDHSWWSPEMKTGMKSYVLQHEQIHFGLTELAARKLTRDAQIWASRFSVIKQSPQEVYSEMHQQINAMINSALEANQKRHLRFDEDTSLFYNPSWQSWWSETVEKELKQTQSGIQGRTRQLFMRLTPRIYLVAQ